MELGDHLEELRRRLVIALVGLLPIFIGALIFAPSVMRWIIAPLIAQLINAGEPAGLLATGPFETFVAYLKVAFAITLIVGFPWVVYQAWKFVAPGLYPSEQRFVYVLIPMSAVLTAGSVAFLFGVLLPISLFFLITFGSGIVESDVGEAAVPAAVVERLEATRLAVLEADPPAEQLEAGMMWLNERRNSVRVWLPPDVRELRLRSDGLIAQEYRIGEYTSLVFRLSIVFAVAFQLPIVMLLGQWSGLMEHRTLGRYRRYVAFGCVIGGAFLTPQDPWSMLLLGGALYGLFELGLVLMRFLTPERVRGGLAGRGTDGDAEA